jgi:hypothetical protein
MTIAFNCAGCGNPFRVPDEMGGRKGKCPKCQLINMIPYAAGAAPPPHQPAPQAYQPPPQHPPSGGSPFADMVNPTVAADEPADGQSAPPSRRKKKSLLLPLMLGGFALLFLLCGGIVAADYFFFHFLLGNAGLGSEQKFIPDKTAYVATIRVDQLLTSDAWKKLKGDVKEVEQQQDDMEKNAKKQFGVELKEIDRITVAGTADGDAVYLVRTKSSVKDADVNSALEGSGVSYEEDKRGSYKLQKQKGGDDEFARAYCVVDSKLILFGRYKTLKTILDRDKKPDLTKGMTAAMAKTDFSKTVAFAVNIEDIVSKMDKGKNNGGGPGPDFGLPFMKNIPGGEEEQFVKFLKKIKGAAGWVKFGSSDVTASVIVLCDDAETAEDVRNILGTALTFLKYASKDSPKELKDAKLSTSSNTATLTATIKVDSIAKLIKAEKEDKKKVDGNQRPFGAEDKVREERMPPPDKMGKAGVP